MKFNIIHVSDLHREPNNPLRNDALLPTLASDWRRYLAEANPDIRMPDLIIVSGDIIHGVKPNTPNYEELLTIQYKEASDFLGRMADQFVGGDKDRIVIVPGNHDVSANHLIESYEHRSMAQDGNKALIPQLFSPNSRLRWSWSECELYEITNDTRYAERMAPFSTFYEEFYEGRRTYELDAAKQFDIFDYQNLNVTIVGFSSCFNNDFLNKQASINPSCISEASIQLNAPTYHDRLRIAVWHHNTEGLPMHSDYMDAEVLQHLIDQGFSLGFHGHQHRAQFLDKRFRYGSDGRITVISAGTLCGATPRRYSRAYNIIEIDSDALQGRLYVREDQNDSSQLPLWGARSLPGVNGNYLSFEYSPPPEPLVRVEASTPLLSNAEKLYSENKFSEAAQLIENLAATDPLARRLLLECMYQDDDLNGIIRYFDPPTSPNEAIYLMEALWTQNEHERLRSFLAESMITASTDPSVVELRDKYTVRLNK